jgi:hypothetical protein
MTERNFTWPWAEDGRRRAVDRFIDNVMLGSDRVDERARLITRLCDTVAPLVGDLGPTTPELIRTSLLAAVSAAHERPLDVVADLLEVLSEAVGVDVDWRDDRLSPGGSLALGACDGHGVSDFALGAVLGVDRDEVGLPPAPPACTRRHHEPRPAQGCVACMLVEADTTTASARVEDIGARPHGVVVDRVVARARAWQAEMVRPRRGSTLAGPSPWTSVAGLAIR